MSSVRDPSANAAGGPSRALRSTGSLPPALAWDEVRTPGWLRRSGRRTTAALVLLVAALTLVPWQQSAPGAGKVTVLAPQGRVQQVDAPVDGRVARWHVRDGERVKAGQLLVELVDNDPDYVGRLEDQGDLLETQIEAAVAKVSAAEQKSDAARGAREAAIAAAEAKLRAAEEDLRGFVRTLEGAEAAARTAELQAERVDALAAEGLRSRVDVENLALTRETARARLGSARADVAEAEAKVATAMHELGEKRAEADGKVALAESELEASRGYEAEIRGKLVSLDVTRSRQGAQRVLAPADGVVARVHGGQGGEQVKRGDALMVVVPLDGEPAVELWIDGRDVALVHPGQEVRVQIEGWPALQFPGSPGVALGTFPGEVAFLDPVDDGQGRFRVMVKPAAGAAWPESTALRQGLRAKGWVMLGQVRLGYELWRRLNDFPPLAAPAKKADEEPSGPLDKGKVSGKAWRPK